MSCQGMNKQGKPCQARGLMGHEFCWFHDPSTTPEMKSEAGRQGAASTNLAASLRRIGREKEALTGQAEAVEATLTPAALALVVPAAGVPITSPEDVQLVVSRALAAVLGGTLPPSHAKAVCDLLRVRIELAALAISERLAKLEKHLTQQQQKTSPLRRVGRR